MEREPRRRRRPALSCIQCRRRKIKCDRKEPCSHCVSAKSHCTYRTYAGEPATEKARAQEIITSSAISPSVFSGTLHSRDILLANGQPKSQAADPSVRLGRAIISDAYVRQEVPTSDDTRNASVHTATAFDQAHTVEKFASGPAPTFNRLQDRSVDDVLVHQPGPHHSHITLNKTRVVSASHWKTNTQQLAPVLACFLQATDGDKIASIEDPETRALVTEMGDLLIKAKGITKRIKMTRPTGSLADPDFGLVNPPREIADQMANYYFQSFESVHRILHVATFWSEYMRYWENPDSVPIPLRLKVLLVVALGSSLSEETNPDDDLRIMTHQWVHAAQTWLSGPLKKDRLSIDGLQIYCLAILARQIFSIGGDLVWLSMGSLIHRAMQIGLHRDPKYLPPMSVLQAEVRRRLWATILELLVHSSLDAAMPTRISLHEFDTEPPSNVNDSQLGEPSSTLEVHHRETFTMTSMQLSLLDSLPARLRILQLLNGLDSEISYLEVLDLTTQIMDSCREIDVFLAKSEIHGATRFHRNLMDFLLRRFILLLHCPFAVKARSNPLFYYSIKVSIDTANGIVCPPPDEAFARLMVIGGGMFREGFRCAGSVISYELIAQTEAKQHESDLHSSNNIEIDHLKRIMETMVDTSEERICLGETNIKGHMFLNQILAHVETIEAGIASEYKIAESGRDSLRHCVHLLERRVAAIPSPFLASVGLTPPEFNENEAYGMDLNHLDFFLGDADFS